ncbi:MAG TPA: hypothetical protein VKF82_06805 [Candidatus Eremiobacteraceae bacterium]|nr:hypothetical protein [Candidatus Eremiobacteraceae bacterium]
MRQHVVAALVAALMIAPAGALADTTPQGTPPQGGPGPGGMGQQVRAQVDQARAAARTAALGALTPANRDRLGQVIGQLAIAQTPDVNAAAKTLDASLSPKESKAVLDAQSAFDAQMKQIMDQARGQMGGGSQDNRPSFGPRPGDQGPPDAGLTLMRLAVPPIGPPQFFRTGGPPPPGS